MGLESDQGQVDPVPTCSERDLCAPAAPRYPRSYPTSSTSDQSSLHRGLRCYMSGLVFSVVIPTSCTFAQLPRPAIPAPLSRLSTAPLVLPRSRRRTGAVRRESKIYRDAEMIC